MDSHADNRQCRAIERQQHSRDARRHLLRKLQDRCGPSNRFDVEGLEYRDLLLVPAEFLARSSAVERPDIEQIITDANFRVDPVEQLDRRIVRIRGQRATREQIDELRLSLQRAGVETSLEYVTPNKGVMKAEATPEAPTGHRPRRASPNARADTAVSVSILDTGVAPCGRSDGWLDGLETSTNTDPLDVFPQPNGLLDVAAGHGTFIAGLFEQVDPGLELHIDRVLDSDGLTNEVDIGCALVQTVRSHLRDNEKLVVNLSLGTDTVDGRPPLALQVAHELVREIEAERNGEVMLVAAAGNDGADLRCWPAAFAEDDSRTVAVAALDEVQEPATWSTHGPWVTCSAIGVAVVSTFVTGEEDPAIDPEAETFGHNAWASWTGTSFAVPQVAARIASIARSNGTSLSAAKDRLFAESGIGNDDNYGTLLDFSGRR